MTQITMITNAENSRPNGPPAGYLVLIFTVRINSKSFPGLYAVHKKTFRQGLAHVYDMA